MNPSPRKGHLLPSVPMPVPYGAHVVETGVQFTVFSRHATRVWLMLFDHPDDNEPTMEFELAPDQNRIGNIWHIHVQEARPGQFYLYRMDGTAPEGLKNYFNPRQWLLDPYALAVSGSPSWGSRWRIEAGQHVHNGAAFPKGVIVRDEYDWTGDQTLNIPLEETIIYETHLRGYTIHPTSGVQHGGTYDGFREKIPYLRDLGITAVEFLPIQEFNEMEYFQDNGPRANLRNFWGYNTLAFFAPNGRYGNRGVHGQQVGEFKDLVKALHQAGIEVILDVVFNHTAESGDGGPYYSFRGIDNSIFYLMDPSGKHYMNYSGCGNTVNSNHPVVRDFIMDCLRYWVLHMHVDGFRFDLASILTRGKNGEVLPDPPLVEKIAEDPALRQTKIIAEAWDAAGTYQVGEFPSDRWSEWNGRFRDDVRRFWAGHDHLLGTLATRLAGSADLYNKNAQTPLKSINFVTAHDGFTLRDLVSYSRKHNEDNQENNRDGENHNFSMNFGHEGETDDAAINIKRQKMQKNLLATMMLSQGVPMLLAGDEFSRTQKGNNNAYCQDNDLSWVDWSLCDRNQDLLAFVRELIRFRRSHPNLRRRTFFSGHGSPDGLQPDIQWFGPEGGEPDWEHGRTLAFLVSGHHRNTGYETDTDDVFAILHNGEHDIDYVIPDAGGEPWQIALSTQDRKPEWKVRQRKLTVAGQSVTVLTSALPP